MCNSAFSARLPKREIHALAAEKRVFAVRERRHTVKEQPRGPAPHRDVAMLQPIALRPVVTCCAAKQEYCRQTERHRNDGRGKIPLVAILVQRHARARFIAIDKAGIRPETGKTGLCRRLSGELLRTASPDDRNFLMAATTLISSRVIAAIATRSR